MSKEFKWTDELILKFVQYTLHDSPTFQGRYKDLEDFKASHSTEDKREWEIVKVNSLGGIWDVSIYPGDCIQKGFFEKIHSVRRLSDGEIFTVGDNCFHGPIRRFNLGGNVITADFEYGDVGCTVSLSVLSKLPQRTKLFTVQLTQEQINKLLKLLE